MKRLINLVRGRYEGHYASVTARRWWSRQDRKAARLSMEVIEYEFSHGAEPIRQIVTDAVLYGDGLMKAEWLGDPPRIHYPPYSRRG